MVGSNDSCAMPITVINTIVAEEFRNATEKLKESKDFDNDVKKYIQENFINHKKIIFSGDGYSKNWEEEAKKRGLSAVKSIVDSIPAFIDKKTIELFEKFKVLNENELKCRYEVGLENYINITNIEALTLVDIAKKQVLPACIHYTTRLANSINSIRNVDSKLDSSVQKELLEETLKYIRELKNDVDILDSNIKTSHAIENLKDKSHAYKDKVAIYMEKVRDSVDALEMIIDKDMWPMPSYGDLLIEL